MRRAWTAPTWIVGALALCLAALLLSLPRGAQAMPTPLAVFLHARRALSSPAEPSALLAAAQQNPAPFAGRVFEVPATVCGLITEDGPVTVLLSVDGGPTLSARLPDSLRDASWIDSGTRLRALVLVARTGNEQSLSNLRVLAAAPEEDVAEDDQRQAARLAQEQAARAARETARLARYARTSSRSLPYNRVNSDRLGSDWAGGRPVAALSPAALRVYGPYRAAIRGLNTRLSENEVDTITTSILYFSERESVDPRLVMAMIIAESDFDITSTSRTGAMGLGQLMPETARGLGVTNAYDPVQNISAAVHLLRGHLDQYGGAPPDAGVIPFNQIALTMAAYNAGPGAVHKYHGVPPYRETRRYVARVTALYRQMCGE